MNRNAEGYSVTVILVLTMVLALPMVAGSAAHAAVATTKHNLSVSGSGTRKATSESEICVFCHAPHNTSPIGQLWNRRLPANSYTPYSSSTLKSAPGQPNGASLLCLSCHDGTIALGDVLSRTTPIGMAGGALTGSALLGTNLSDDHPVSFVFNAALRAARGELTDPATLVKPSKVRLDASGRLQCTACHDPHDNTNAKFLVVPNTASALCQTCHVKNYWTGSDHRNSSKTWNNVAPNPWPHTTATTVGANACENCHQPHTAGGGQRLLNYAAEESNCFPCHNGNVATKNIQSEFNKASVHHVANYAGTHNPAETDPVATVHVECVDCHNPHAAYASTLPTEGGSGTPGLQGSQTGVRGVNISGSPVKPAATEYEICFRCHADGAGNTPPASTARVIVQNNKRMEFLTTNPSFHPIAAAGRSATVPSLATGWTISSRVKCTDCHNNNAGPYSTGNGITAGAGVNGPHGSTYPTLLERQYLTADTTSESAAAYALCYKCHNRTSILADQTGSFKEHNKHIVAERAPCNICHDPHGVGAPGTTLSNSRLMNFNTAVVTRSGTQAIRWERVGTTGGRCYLTCHGKDHNPLTY